MTTPDEPTPDEARPTPVEPAAAVEPAAPAEPPAAVEPAITAEPVEPAGPARTPPPTAAELERIAEPARVRRAPKYGAFITAGVLAGVVLAVVLVGVVDTTGVEIAPGSGFLPFLEGPSGVMTVLAVLLGGLGALVGGWCAVLADRRSRPGADGADAAG